MVGLGGWVGIVFVSSLPYQSPALNKEADISFLHIILHPSASRFGWSPITNGIRSWKGLFGQPIL